MTIGILTYHRSHNYGAILQAMALRKVISDMGYEVRYVDYWPAYHIKMYALINWDLFKSIRNSKRIKYALILALIFPFKYLRFRKFRKFITRHIEPYCNPCTNFWDLIVCGSDQIWRKQPSIGNQFNPEYFGAGEIKSEKYISYAASMGMLNIDESDVNRLVEWLSKFTSISVREDSLRTLLINGGLKDVSTVIDPTLLISKDVWLSLIGNEKQEVKKKYLLVYDLLIGSFDYEMVYKIARSKGLIVKILSGNVTEEIYKHKTISVADPFDMIRLIKDAEMVFTSSYHGLVFSILFERQFVASFSYNSERAESLLRQIGLSDRLISNGSTTIPSNQINYAQIRDKLKAISDSSKDWLRKALDQQHKNVL